MSRKDPARHWRDRALDAIEASQETREFVQEMEFAAFAADARTVKAVLANFSIMGEATAYIPEERLATHPEIPWVKVRAMRNIMVHVYFGIDLQIVWETIHQDLLPMEAALRDMLDRKDA